MYQVNVVHAVGSGSLLVAKKERNVTFAICAQGVEAQTGRRADAQERMQ